MNRKQLEILLSKHVSSFDNPKVELEQYQTPPRVAANLLHFCQNQGHLVDKNVIDVCAGTGILGLGAAILGGNVTLIEKDIEAVKILEENASKLDIDVNIIHDDVFSHSFDTKFDTAILNPPFGIQQKEKTDIDFLICAAKITKYLYSIHDGSPANQERLPDLIRNQGIDPQGMYVDEFPIDNTYTWHAEIRKIHHVMILWSISKL